MRESHESREQLRALLKLNSFPCHVGTPNFRLLDTIRSGLSHCMSLVRNRERKRDRTPRLRLWRVGVRTMEVLPADSFRLAGSVVASVQAGRPPARGCTRLGLEPAALAEPGGEGAADGHLAAVHEAEHDAAVPALDPIEGCARDPVGAVHLGSVEPLDLA